MKEGLPKKVSEAGCRLADFCIGRAAPPPHVVRCLHEGVGLTADSTQQSTFLGMKLRENCKVDYNSKFGRGKKKKKATPQKLILCQAKSKESPLQLNLPKILPQLLATKGTGIRWLLTHQCQKRLRTQTQEWRFGGTSL